MKKLIIIVALACLAAACGGETKAKNGEDGPIVYNIMLEESLKEKRQFKLSDIAESLEYIELKTPPDMSVMAWQIAVSKDYIFINSRGEIYQFTISGDFLRPVGRRGKGPGEYLSAQDIVIDEKNERISVVSAGMLYNYSFGGN